MSASDKKKLRKEQQSAAMTEKQRAEKKEQKKQKAYTLTFVIVMVLVVAIVLVSVLSTPVRNLMMQNTTSVTVNGHKIDAVEFNYYYMDYIKNFYNQFSSGGDYQDLYVQMYTGLNPAKSLDSQTYNSATGETWADYFTDCTIESIEWSYTMYDAAQAAGYTLSESEQESLDSIVSSFELAAAYYGFSNASNYLKTMYGSSASMDSYVEYYKISKIASSYASAYIDSLEFTDTDFREFEADKKQEYNSYSYAYIYLNSSYYLTGGTTVKGEDGKETTTYSDEEKAAAVELALKDAKALAVEGNNTVEKLNLAIGKLTATGLSKTADESTAVLYSSLPSIKGMAEWLSDSERTAGDITYIASTTHTHAAGEEHSDDEDTSAYDTVNGYYVVLYLDTIDNTMNIGSVRHLLVAFEKDKDNNVTDEAKAAALAEAEKLLEEYKAGEMTEEAFTKLLTEHSDDINSTTKKPNNDGLYTDITPDSGYSDSFTKWATADHEKGDVEIIESEHGYHIMYYVGAADLNYRDTLINNDLIDKAYTEWQDSLLEKTTTVEGNLKYVNSGLVISQ